MTRPVERAQLICWMKTVCRERWLAHRMITKNRMRKTPTKPKGVMLLELTSELCLPSPNPMPV